MDPLLSSPLSSRLNKKRSVQIVGNEFNKKKYPFFTRQLFDNVKQGRDDGLINHRELYLSIYLSIYHILSNT